MKILINIIRFILIISSFCSKAEIFESIHSTTPIHVTSSKKKNYFNYSLQRLSLKPIINLRNEEVATYLNFEQEKELDKYIKQYASGSIKDLNKAIFDNQKVLDKVGIGTLNYIIDYRNVLSTESKDNINAQLRSLYVETGKSLYIILSPIIPEQLSYAAQASSEFRYSSKNTSIYNTQFTLEQRNEFYKRYTSYVAANSNLSTTSNSGALLNIQSVLHYNKNVNKWVVDFLDYVCFTKNINPEVAQSIAQGIQQYKNQIGGITFSNSISVISQSLIQYVDIIDWEFRIAFVTQNANNQLNRSIGKYRVVLSQISEDDKNAIFQKLTTTNNPTTYNPVKRSGYLVDYANLDSYIERIFWRFSLMNVQTSSDIKCFVYTSSSLNNESGKLAFQLISEKTLEASTIGFGYHFVKEGEQLVMYWNVKLSNDLNGFIDAASLDSMFRDIGSLNFGEATAYYTKHYLLEKYTQAKVAVTDAYQWGYERVFMFYEFVRTVIHEGRIPETVYGDSVILASIVGLLNCVIDEIKGIYQIGVFVMDIALLPTKLLNECLLFFYYYSIDSAFRSRIDANISFITNNIQLITSSIILDVADTFGFAPSMGVPPDNINPETNTGGFQSSLLTKIKNIDVVELDRSITNTLSVPFIAFGTALENCYTNSTLAQKAYCSAYGVGTIVLIFCGEKIYQTAGTLVTKLGTSVLARFTVRLGSSFSKSKISALLDNFVEYAQGAIARIRGNVSKVKAGSIFDLSVFKSLTARIPSGGKLTNLKKSEFLTYGYKVKPTSGPLKNQIDDIIANGDNLGRKTEDIVDNIMSQNGYSKLDGKYGGNNGYDGIYIKGDINNPTEIIIIESKQFKYTNGVADDILEHNGVTLNSPSATTPLPSQMSDAWVQYVQNKLRAEGKTGVANMIRDFDDKITKYVAAVDKTKAEINFLKLGTY
ncbi:MAG: hypothetical protein MUE33_00590 [Cytophagaceae bacterium]|jgi:hypothetical protein|nr:hypothetical protein [Cytophagaceae bacterium]